MLNDLLRLAFLVTCQQFERQRRALSMILLWKRRRNALELWLVFCVGFELQFLKFRLEKCLKLHKSSTRERFVNILANILYFAQTNDSFNFK